MAKLHKNERNAMKIIENIFIHCRVFSNFDAVIVTKKRAQSNEHQKNNFSSSPVAHNIGKTRLAENDIL